MRCKIVKTQKLMWRNIMKSTKSQKVSVLHYSIDIELINCNIVSLKIKNFNYFIYIYISGNPETILLNEPVPKYFVLTDKPERAPKLN